MAKKDYLGISLDAKLKVRINQLAAEEDTSTSDIVTRALEAYVGTSLKATRYKLLDTLTSALRTALDMQEMELTEQARAKATIMRREVEDIIIKIKSSKTPFQELRKYESTESWKQLPPEMQAMIKKAFAEALEPKR